ncbi:MAG: hypothetical protein ACRDOK_02780 [Streptosporangiaceae bacterium]
MKRPRTRGMWRFGDNVADIEATFDEVARELGIGEVPGARGRSIKIIYS